MLKNLFSRGGESAAQTAAPAEAQTPQARNYTVGWFLQKQKTSIIWDAPKPVRVDSQSKAARSVGRCPSVLDFDRRFFTINSPIDVHMRLTMREGGMSITNMLAEESPIRSGALQQWIVFQPQEEWRHPNRPVLQMLTSYIFVSDDPVYINQYPPFLHYEGNSPRPGVQIGGRFPIDIWPRALMWAFEWHDTSKDLVLKRGEPLFYVRFEGPDPSASVRLVEAKKTPELEEYVESITGVTEFVTQTYSLFKTARERRPEKLLFPKD